MIRLLTPYITMMLCLLLFACKPATTSDSTNTNTTASSASSKEYKIDVAHSELKWQAFKAVGSHSGIVPVLEGNVFVDGNNITGGKVILDMKNLQVTDLEGDDKLGLESHLKGLEADEQDHFFNTNKFPTATYQITGSTPISGDSEATHMVKGELTMRGITNPVNMRVKLDAGAGNAIKITAPPFTIDRTLWGIKFESKKFFDNLKNDFIYDEIKIELTIGAIQ
jgi:polyisoprenoid-binding protein YceI